MIYTSTAISDELEKPFVGQANHKWKIFVDAVLVVVLTFICSTVFSTLADTVVGEKMTLFSDQTLFSIISLINIIIPGFVAFYLYSDYRRMTFNDLYNNKMYMLIKMGQKANRVVYTRLLSIVLYTLSLYLIVFVLSLGTCLILNYQLSLGNQFNLIILGFILSLASAFTVLSISTFIKERKYGVLLFIAFFIGFILYAFLSSFDKVMSSETKMMYLKNLFDFQMTDGFIYAVLLLSVFDLGEIIISCQRESALYHTSLPLRKDLVVIDYSSNKVIEPKKDFSSLIKKALKYFNYTIFSLLCLSALATNFYLISIGSKNIANDYQAGTDISMIFASSTMAPSIYANDFVTFRTLDKKEEVLQGDIIYYQKEITASDGSKSTYPTVVKVININNGIDYNVDVTNSVSGTDMSDTLTREEIVGKLVYVSRPLGAWIVFNQSIIGKIIMIGGPLFIILFYDNFAKFGKAYKLVSEEESEDNEKKFHKEGK
ncbi:MAG: hypothetical protein LKJ88_00520 [Bacilli bacterium]|jgi:hypothetical protein|nr:hypothetical protein [Bacilli bacterium]